MSDSVWPQRWQPTRLRCPWDSPGKNTGVDCHFLLQCRKVKSESEVTQSCPTPCDPIDGSPPGSPIPGILQARTLEWIAISFSIAWKWKVKVKSLSRVQLLATPWTAAYQAPPSMGFSRQEYWSGLPLPSPWFTASRSEIPVTTWTYYWHSELTWVGGISNLLLGYQNIGKNLGVCWEWVSVTWDRALNLWSMMVFPGEQYQNWVEL